MRKVLNILQSTALAFSEKESLKEEDFYMCTGSPIPEDIKQIVNWMLTLDITSSFKQIQKLKTEKGMALADIMTEVHKYLERIDFPPKVRIYLLKEFADLEYRLSIGTSEKLQLAALVSAFYNCRDMVKESA